MFSRKLSLVSLVSPMWLVSLVSLVAVGFALTGCPTPPPPPVPIPTPPPSGTTVPPGQACKDPPVPVATAQAPGASGAPRKDGFNELFVNGYLYHRGVFEKECPAGAKEACPTNSPPIRLDQAGQVLDSLAQRASLTFREIVPLRVVEPRSGAYPYDADVVGALRLYHDRGLSLVLAFGGPLPAWVKSDAQYAAVICGFVERLATVHGLSRSWVLNRLRIEPTTEIGGDTQEGTDREGIARVAAARDGGVTQCLRQKRLYTRVLASSFLAWERRSLPLGDPSGEDLVPVVDYFRRYYRHGGTGAPNVHLYPANDPSTSIPSESTSTALARYHTILGALSTGLPRGLPGGQRFNINVGEIGFYDHVSGDAASAAAHAELLPTLLNDGAFNSSVRSYQVWRLLRRWHSHCLALCGQEISWGFIKAPLPAAQQPPVPWECVAPTSFEAEPVFAKLYQQGQAQALPRADVGDWNALLRYERGELNLVQGAGIKAAGVHLAMQEDGNLVLYRDGKPLWSVFSHESQVTSPQCSQSEPCSVRFQDDGHLVLYRGNTAYWSSKTNLTGQVLVIHSAPPYLTIQADNGQPVFQSGVKASDVVGNAWTNSAGFKLLVAANDPDGTALQFDANSRLVLQPDGNLVLYDSASRAVWSVFGNESVKFAPNCSSGGCALHFQTDGNLVLYNGSPYWWSGSNGAKRTLRFDNRSQYLFVLDESGKAIWSLPGVR